MATKRMQSANVQLVLISYLQVSTIERRNTIIMSVPVPVRLASVFRRRGNMHEYGVSARIGQVLSGTMGQVFQHCPMEIFHIVLVTRLFNYHGISSSSSRSRSALFVSICLVAKPVSKFGCRFIFKFAFLCCSKSLLNLTSVLLCRISRELFSVSRRVSFTASFHITGHFETPQVTIVTIEISETTVCSPCKWPRLLTMLCYCIGAMFISWWLPS